MYDTLNMATGSICSALVPVTVPTRPKVLFCRSGLASSNEHSHAGAPFKEATETDGFYNRPPGDGRFPVRSVDAYRTPYPVNAQAVYPVHDRYALCSSIYTLVCHDTCEGTSFHSRYRTFVPVPTRRTTGRPTLPYTASAFPVRSAAHAVIPA